ncbi:MAG: metallophosphatase [Chitinophagaceae bacterium]
MLSRRKFLAQSALTAGAILSSNTLLASMNELESVNRLTILHTNDVHSRLDPFPMDGSKYEGCGGVAARAELIKKIREEEQHVLLLDAGDIFQGTPYFNVYKGEPEIKAMSAMNYDAATMGNHDFDGGLENFASQLMHANFPLIICNYDFSGTAMENKFLPYKIFRMGKIKVGITAVGIELHGLVPDNLFGSTVYMDPVMKANDTAYKLKREHNCDFVICLSHLGYKYQYGKVSDMILAKDSEYVDLIIGGHSHTFFDEPELVKNKMGSDVLINQVGWGGLVLGRLDFEFSKIKNKIFLKSHTVVVRKKTT